MNDQQLIDALSTKEQPARLLREGLARLRQLSGEHRKGRILRDKGQAIIDQVQIDVVEVKAVVVAAHRELVAIGVQVELPSSVTSEAEPGG